MTFLIALYVDKIAIQMYKCELSSLLIIIIIILHINFTVETTRSAIPGTRTYLKIINFR